MVNVCPQCGEGIGGENPMSRYENDPNSTPMCAGCVQVWADRVARAAKDETDAIRSESRRKIDEVRKRYASQVSPRGPMGGR